MDDKKMGRPTDSPKNTMLRIRIDDETLEKLDECVTEEKSNRSEVVRKSIRKYHSDSKG